MSVKFSRGLRSAQESRQLCKVRSPISARQNRKAGRAGNAFDPSDGQKAKDFSKRGQASLGNRGASQVSRPSGGGGPKAVRKGGGGAEDMSAAAVAAAEDMSAAAVAVVVAVVGAAAGVVPTSASRKTSSRWCGSTTVSNSIASATRAAIEPPMWASWRRRCSKVEPSAVWRDHDGYLMVDYDRIGLKFMTWKEWLARSGASSPSLP